MRFDHRMDRETAKKVRAQKVAKIVVTVDGIPLDGDETSQTRMAKAIVGMDPGETITWRCADNVDRQLTKDQLRVALRLAGAEQTKLWFV